MRMTIEIEQFTDLLALRDMLNNGMAPFIASDELVDPNVTLTKDGQFYNQLTHKYVDSDRKPNGAERAVEAVSAPEVSTPVEEPETAPVAPPEPEAANPFADEIGKKPAKAKKLTREDVNAAFHEYITTFGQTAAMADVVKLLSENFKVAKIKDIPAASFEKAIQAVHNAIETNQFNRERI